MAIEKGSFLSNEEKEKRARRITEATLILRLLGEGFFTGDRHRDIARAEKFLNDIIHENDFTKD